jgi:UDP-N-acetylglucosamine 2-epimerase (non-hydrolysing)
MEKIKITTILGTRPEIIRLAEISKKFDQFFEHRVIHTGQNNSASLSDIFFNDLSLRKPDVSLGILSNNLGDFLGQLFPALQIEFTNNRPDALVILGDTNSSLAAILARRMQIPVYHLEAGNRSFDLNVPEEINRKIVDHASDFNLCYTNHAARNLQSEGIHSRFVSVIGSPLREVLNSNSERISKSKVLSKLGLSAELYFLVSLHRQENIDNPLRLSALIKCLNLLADEYKMPIIVSAHPRFADKVSQIGEKFNDLISLQEPFGFTDYIKLQLSSHLVLSDSGSVSEEAAILGFKAVTVRDSMERPEALESGTIIMSGTQPSSFLQSVRIALLNKGTSECPADYQIPDSSTRVVNFIVSTLGQVKFWQGLRQWD